MKANPDPVAEFSKTLRKEMNGNWKTKLEIAVRSFLGFSIDEVVLKRVDRYGVDFLCTAFGLKSFPCRIPFISEAKNEKELMHQINILLNGSIVC